MLLLTNLRPFFSAKDLTLRTNSLALLSYPEVKFLVTEEGLGGPLHKQRLKMLCSDEDVLRCVLRCVMCFVFFMKCLAN